MRVREPPRQRRLLASLADIGQQTPIVVVTTATPERYLVIDGHKRVAALEAPMRPAVGPGTGLRPRGKHRLADQVFGLVQLQLARLFDRIQAVLESYTDEDA